MSLILTVFLYAAVIIIALLLIGLILIQPSKSGGTGAAFGGVGESVFGAQAGSHLTKATVVMISLFFLLVLVLATIIGRSGNQDRDSGVEKALQSGLNEAKTEAPAGVAAPVAPVVPDAPAADKTGETKK